MAHLIVVLSGRIASGKSTLAEQLKNLFDATVVKTWELLVSLNPDLEEDRKALQEFGDQMDVKTEGKWIAQALGRKITIWGVTISS